MASSRQVEVDGRELKLTNLDKVLYPEVGFTKGEMVDYYAKVAPAMVPHLRGRAVTLRRFPEGVDDLDSAFFEKRCPKHRPKWVKTTSVRAGPNAGKIDFCVCDGRPTLVWMAQLAAIELHPSLSLGGRRRGRPCSPSTSTPGRRPTSSTAAGWRCACARCSATSASSASPRPRARRGCRSTSRSTPKRSTTTMTKPFAKAIAQLLEKQTPDLVVSKMKKVERGGKVFVDWSQNHRSKTTIAVYSLRARERPTASTPVRWDEVEAAAESGDGSRARLRGRRVLERIERHGDLFAPVLELEQELPEL